ncbi:MAG: YraN family protein [Lachnospiraceae bacterium]|nr:YraN family protein [Lachnospiraceae bacterium]
MNKKSNTRSVGARYEELVAQYLTRQGAKIVTRNFRARNGEIDLVVRDGAYLVFLEVKYRTTGRAGSGAEAVNLKKQKTICRISDFYRVRFALPDSTRIRYDVVECTAEERGEVVVNWYKNAFPYHPAGGKACRNS